VCRAAYGASPRRRKFRFLATARRTVCFVAARGACPAQSAARPSAAEATPDACVCEGVLDNGDKITINLPPEPVVFSRLDRQGLRLRVVVVAVPIECPAVLTRSNGERYEGTVTFLACEAHAVGRGARLADAMTTPDAVLALIPGTK
jgi:hypothetical protein